MRNFLRKKFIISGSKGFTLVELMVTVAIFVFMTALILARYNNFYSGTIFRNLAYDVALTIRQAQTYGISVKASSANADNFSKAFGVRFSIGQLYGSCPTNATSFSLCSYNSDNTVSISEKRFNLKNGAKISRLRVGSGSAPNTQISTLNIIFRRPNPDATICLGSIVAPTSCDYKSAEIRLSSPSGTTYMFVRVNSVGQIRVSDT